jgi:hypothetical protein
MLTILTAVILVPVAVTEQQGVQVTRVWEVSMATMVSSLSWADPVAAVRLGMVRGEVEAEVRF